MSDKTESKKQYILSKAKVIFETKGFKDVTMKDVVEACEISRGGLYLYYSSVEEIFLDVIKMVEESDSQEDVAAMWENSTPSELMVWFIREQKKEIIGKKNTLALAMYEYAFYCKHEGKGVSDNKFDTTVRVLEGILERGNETGEFDCPNPKLTASNMMFAIEGLKIMTVAGNVSQKKVDNELVYMMRQFMDV